MEKNRKHSTEFRQQIVNDHLQGESLMSISKRSAISKTLVKKWVDHHRLLGQDGLLPRRTLYYSKEFKLKVVKAYKDKGLSLRNCCLQFNIPSQSTLVTWARKYEQQGLDGLNEQKGRPTTMKKDKPASKKKAEPLTRLEELERENLYLKAEIDFLKKLDALTQAKQTQQKKKH
jgi:transposase